MTFGKIGVISPLDLKATEPFYRQIYNRVRGAIYSGLVKQ
jgi:GntR family transcriptional regulator/MocR family aminotransferase